MWGCNEAPHSWKQQDCTFAGLWRQSKHSLGRSRHGLVDLGWSGRVSADLGRPGLVVQVTPSGCAVIVRCLWTLLPSGRILGSKMVTAQPVARST